MDQVKGKQAEDKRLAARTQSSLIAAHEQASFRHSAMAR